MSKSDHSSDPYGMTETRVSKICKDKGGFRTPELNEQLYLHFQGFRKIENIDAFKNCRCLWLENNLLTEVENLEKLKKLDSLYLQHNTIRSLTNLTTPLHSLRSLNISHNFLDSLKGVEFLPNLEKLIASKNEIEDISPVSALANLSVLDLSFNKLADPTKVREIVSKSKKLASLMLHGNDFIRQVKNYRKVMIFENASLRYLDEYPVFDDERRCASAFCEGGIVKEKSERDQIRQEEIDRQARQRVYFQQVIENAKKKHSAAPPVPTSYFLQMKEELGGDDDEIYVPHTKAPAAVATVAKVGVTKAVPLKSRHVDVMASLNDGCPAEPEEEPARDMAEDATSPRLVVKQVVCPELTEEKVLETVKLETPVVEEIKKLFLREGSTGGSSAEAVAVVPSSAVEDPVDVDDEAAEDISIEGVDEDTHLEQQPTKLVVQAEKVSE